MSLSCLDMSINFYLPLLFPPLKHCQCVALFFTNCSICIQYTSNLIRIHLILSAALNSLIESPFFFCGCWKKYQITIRWSNSICLFFFRILKAGIPFNRTSFFLLDVTFARQNTTEIAFNVNVNRMSLFLFSFAKSTTSLLVQKLVYQRWEWKCSPKQAWLRQSR